MSNPIQSLNENFLYNSLLARALVPLMPACDRMTLRLWLHVLHEVVGETEMLKIRNEYMWFLLLGLQSKKITQPFTSEPPKGTLRPLKDILPNEIYEDVLMATDQNMSWLSKVSTGISGDVSATCSAVPSGPPALFLQNQPKPKNGVMCYMAAFSDQT